MKIIKINIVIALFSFLWACEPSRIVVKERLATPVYVRPPAPRPNYVWIDGNWHWKKRNYVYRNGYWTAPRKNRVLIAGTWAQHGNGYRWKKGRWHRH